MKKFAGVLILIICCMVLLRVSFGNQDRPISLWNSMKEAERTGSFFDFSEVFVDAQKTRYNYLSLVNALKADNGSQYTEYVWSDIGTIPIYNTHGETVGYFYEAQRSKPEYGSGILEWIEFIGYFLLYIGKIFMYGGLLIIDLSWCLIKTISGVLIFLYNVCFV